MDWIFVTFLWQKKNELWVLMIYQTQRNWLAANRFYRVHLQTLYSLFVLYIHKMCYFEIRQVKLEDLLVVIQLFYQNYTCGILK